MLRIGIVVLLVLESGFPAIASSPSGRSGTGPAHGKGLAADTSATAREHCADVPQDLTSADWSSIRQAYDAGRHTVLAVEGGYRARNPGQQWHSRFDGRGVTVQPDTGGWEWGLQLERYGFAGEERAVSRPRSVNAAGQRLVHVWDEILEEWYVNDTRGLEHGYTVHQRPPLGSRSESGPLTFTLAVRGDLRSEVQDDGHGVRFASSNGAAVLTYSGLSALDADGQELVARLERVPEGLVLFIDDRDARYPLTIDPIAQQAYLKASNTDAADFFGSSVSVSGDTIVVGSLYEDSAASGVNGDQSDDSAMNSGAAYVFVRNGTTWSQEAYLKASNTQEGDFFGARVAVSGDTIAVGAWGEDSAAMGVNGDPDDNKASYSGAAYVFVRKGTTWSQEAYLKASNAEASDFFGGSIAISGDIVVVRAWGEDSSATGVNGDQSDNSAVDSGAAYVFVRKAARWSQEAYLKASNTEAGDLFGFSIAVSGETILVGAYLEDSSATGLNGNQNDNSATESGAAYVFVRNGTTWHQQAYLKASNTNAGDGFGQSVAASGETIVVGARGEDSAATGVNGEQSSNSTADSGAAYVFVRNGTTWSQQAYLKASNTGVNDAFAHAVDISGDIVVIGADWEDSNATGVNGNQDNNFAILSGAAYVFLRNRTTWSQEAYLKASNTGTEDLFGDPVAVSGGTVVVGAHNEDSNATGVNGNQHDNSSSGSGAVYVFQICSQATVVFRNAGSNPASYVANPIVIGVPFTATVDNNLASQVSSLLFAFDTTTSFPLGGGQVLLCYDVGSGEIFTGFNLAPSSNSGGVDSYSLAVPNDPSLAGFSFGSQAIQFGNPPFFLSNAQDLTIGSF